MHVHRSRVSVPHLVRPVFLAGLLASFLAVPAGARAAFGASATRSADSSARASGAAATGRARSVLAAPRPRAPAPDSLPTIEAMTRGMKKMDGFLPLYWDASTGHLWMEIGHFDQEILHYNSLPQGIGNNDIGLNRGDLGAQEVFRFERVGPKVLMVQSNYRFRADSTDNPAERRAVRDAFARSVLWGFKVSAETGGRVLVDATDFALRDAHGVVGTLKRTGQGDFRLDPTRSAIHLDETKDFPKNTEIDATLTFTSDDPGPLERSVTPTPGALTVREHHSFVQLPEPWKRRKAVPGSGYFDIQYMDFTAPLGDPMTKRFIERHRLEKKDPTAPLSDPVRPIVYYLDPGTPEPVRSALLDGARWWNQAFAAIGYRNAFQVRMLPPGADPMDVRYNVIQWVHRSTRGWSYGNSVVDPRTGEILKGHVTLGSLRVRQDYLIATGLLSPYGDANGGGNDAAARQMALARLRQLAAHEIGHTLGLQHNYISSAERADGIQSVMDYPQPLVRLDPRGNIDLSHAYETGIGRWDKVAIAYGYQDFPDGVDQDSALAAILTNARKEGITFLTDQDARPSGSAHPLVHLWDNGRDPAYELNRMMDVRRVALDRFGAGAIKEGWPLATMEEALVPVYLFHRYQTTAASKVVGGEYYTYAMKGDGQAPLKRVPAPEQEAALHALMRTLDAHELALPRVVVDSLPPRPTHYQATPELFQRWTGLVFDAVSPAAAAARHTVSLLLDPERASRLVEQKALDPSLPGLGQVLDTLVANTFGRSYDDPYEAEIGRTVQRVVGEEMMRLAGSAPMPQVRAVTTNRLRRLQDRLRSAARGDSEAAADASYLAGDIQRFLDRPPRPAPEAPSLPTPPPGDPIGASGPWGGADAW